MRLLLATFDRFTSQPASQPASQPKSQGNGKGYIEKQKPEPAKSVRESQRQSVSQSVSHSIDILIDVAAARLLLLLLWGISICGRRLRRLLRHEQENYIDDDDDVVATPSVFIIIAMGFWSGFVLAISELQVCECCWHAAPVGRILETRFLVWRLRLFVCWSRWALLRISNFGFQA